MTPSTTTTLAELTGQPDSGFAVLAVIGIVVVTFMGMLVWLSRYTKVGPNQVLIVSGRMHQIIQPDGSVLKIGFRIVKGGGTFVMPVVERADVLSLEVMPVRLKIPDGATADGALVALQCQAQIKIKGDDTSIVSAAEHFLNKTADDIKDVAAQIIEAHLRNAVRTMKEEDLLADQGPLASRVQEAASAELAGMGLAIVSYLIRAVVGGQSLGGSTSQAGHFAGSPRQQ